MKTKLAVVAVLAVSGSAAGVAAAGVLGGRGVPAKAYSLHSGQAITYSGITCTAYEAQAAAGGTLVCVRNDLRGYGVIVSEARVVVAKQNRGGSVRIVFQKPNG